MNLCCNKFESIVFNIAKPIFRKIWSRAKTSIYYNTNNYE